MNQMAKRKALPASTTVALKKMMGESKLRLTPIRLKVLELMSALNRSVGAYELLAQLQKRELAFKAITVYRALEFLLDNGLIHRIESSNAYVICSRPGERHQSQLLVCDACGHVAELDLRTLTRELNKKAEVAGFQRTSQVIETHGFCRSCRS